MMENGSLVPYRANPQLPVSQCLPIIPTCTLNDLGISTTGRATVVTFVAWSQTLRTRATNLKSKVWGAECVQVL